MTQAPVPSRLLVMAEHGVEDPVWAGPPSPGDPVGPVDQVGPVDLEALSVDGGLVARLRAWNARYEALARSGYAWPDPEEARAWRRDGLHLAYELQSELPEVEVSYHEDGDGRPVRERRGR